ncbi:MAG: TonB-dependent receptor [Pseudomonadota bacterium]
MRTVSTRPGLGFTHALGITLTAATLGVPAQADVELPVLEEMVVTAQHRVQDERDVGISMAVFSADAIAELDITSSYDVARHTPGMTMTDSGGGAVPVYTLRGVGFDDHQPNSSSTVGVYVDQVALPYPIMTMGLKYDLERIEVLKGPQGDLYGRNTTGGALNYIANRPDDTLSGGVSLGAGNFETVDLRGYVNGPLGERVNARLAAAGKSRNKGWQEDELSGELVGAYDQYSVRAMFDIAATDDLDVRLTLRTERFNGEPQTPQSTVVLPSSNAQAAFLNSLNLYPVASLDPLMVENQDSNEAVRFNRTPDHDSRHSGGAMHIDWRIGELTFTSITGYERFERELSLDWDGTQARLLEVDADTEIESLTQEFRLASPDGGRLNWLAGVYLSDDTVTDTSNYDDSESPTVGFTFGSASEQETQSVAGFGHLQWQFAEQFRVNAGARYTREERAIENCTTDTGDGSAATALLTFELLGLYTLENPEALVPGACVHLEGTGTSTNPPAPDVRVPGLHVDEIKTSQTTGKLGLDWLPGDDWLVFGSVATGFKSGGYNTFSALVVDQFEPYDEETLMAYEAGFKGRVLDQRLALTGAVFRYDYEDKQVSTIIPDQLGVFPGLVGIVNVPESRITGVELGADWLVTESLSLTVNAAFLDAEVTEYDGAFDAFNQVIFDAAGQPLPNAPEQSYQFLGTYERPIAASLLMRLSLSYTYQSESYSQISAIEQFEVDSRGLLDARLTLAAAAGSWSVALWGQNLTDETYGYSNATAQDNIVRYTGMPRTYGLVFDYHLN